MLEDDARAELERLEREGLLRDRRVVSGRQGVVIELDGRRVVNFSANDYLGLAGHETLAAAATAAIASAGVGAGSSRLIVGNTSHHQRLEMKIEGWLERMALVFNSGYAANTGVLPALALAGDVILSDELNHASIIDGCRLSRADVVIYRHLDLADLERKLSESRGRRVVIVTETLFSMDGDIVDIVEVDRLRRTFGASLIVDEAHALGAMGEGGRGIAMSAGVIPDVLIGTLGKALGSQGAFACGGQATLELLWNRARSLVFSTAIPGAIAAASIAAIELVRSHEGDQRRAALAANVERLAARTQPGPIQPMPVGDDRRVMEISERLLDAGLYVQGIRPPTVPVGTSRLRVALSANHTANHLELINNALRRVT